MSILVRLMAILTYGKILKQSKIKSTQFLHLSIFKAKNL
ncbi:hypothetical protein CUP0519 [Campylobacter upsaliensis RM3195]|nr:hypothetical protein CUP0519 [Campylobacter upsaliensis RM3195]